MIKQIAAAVSLATLVACGSGFNTGFESHNYDWPEKVGTVEELWQLDGRVFRIHWLRADLAADACKRFMPFTDAQACSVWPTGKPLAKWEIKILAGANCLIYLPPVESIYRHELRRCIEGAKYDVGIMREVKE